MPYRKADVHACTPRTRRGSSAGSLCPAIYVTRHQIGSYPGRLVCSPNTWMQATALLYLIATHAGPDGIAEGLDPAEMGRCFGGVAEARVEELLGLLERAGVLYTAGPR